MPLICRKCSHFVHSILHPVGAQVPDQHCGMLTIMFTLFSLNLDITRTRPPILEVHSGAKEVVVDSIVDGGCSGIAVERITECS